MFIGEEVYGYVYRGRSDNAFRHIQMGKLRLGEVKGLFQATQEYWTVRGWATGLWRVVYFQYSRLRIWL